MNDRRAIRWLHAQLPALVEKGVLSPEAAAALRLHYPVSPQPRGLGMIVSAILGATLIGLGLILLLAHNWDELDKITRTAISFAPLLAAIALSMFTILRRQVSAAWCEGASIFQMLAVAVAIALVSQTWHIAGDFYDFLLTWMLLGVPLAYLFRATLPAAVYIAGIVVWAAGPAMRGESPLWAWPLLFVIAPFYAQRLRENPQGHRSDALSLLLALGVPLTLGFALERHAPDLWIPAFAGLFAVMYLVSALWFEKSEHHAHPFRDAGALGIAAFSIILSYRDAWTRSAAALHPATTAACAVSWVGGLGLPLLAMALAIFGIVKKRDVNPLAAALAPAALLGWWLTQKAHAQTDAALLFNGYALALGIVTLLRGVRRERIGSANAGMAVIAALVVSRFFDSDFSFVARGLAFIGIGVGFLVANVFLFKRRALSA